jgi:hypothetical protein
VALVPFSADFRASLLAKLCQGVGSGTYCASWPRTRCSIGLQAGLVTCLPTAVYWLAALPGLARLLATDHRPPLRRDLLDGSAPGPCKPEVMLAKQFIFELHA